MTRSSMSHIRELPTSAELPADGRILFFRRDRETFFWLSHFHAAEIVIDGETWPTVEHYFQSRKSFDPEYHAAIRAYDYPGMVKRIAASPHGSRKRSGQSWFRAHGREYRSDWSEVQLDVMRLADRAKFTQHPALKALLVSTGKAEIIEDTTMDDFWGVGADGQGHNWAGRILMEIRKELQSTY